MLKKRQKGQILRGCEMVTITNDNGVLIMTFEIDKRISILLHVYVDCCRRHNVTLELLLILS